MWEKISEVFSTSADIPRSAQELEKKWYNLIAKHRGIYSDFKRNQTLTGGGPAPKPLDPITEKVMDVIGRDNVSVVGLLSGIDTAVVVSENVIPTPSSSDVEIHEDLVTGPTCNIEWSAFKVNDNALTSCCCGDAELVALQKEKIKLEIKLLKRKLDLET